MPETVTQSQETAQAEHKSPAQMDIRQSIDHKVETRQVPFNPDPLLRCPPRLPDLKENRRDLLSDLDTDINIDFEENSPYQEGIILETYERPDKSDIKKPPEVRFT